METVDEFNEDTAEKFDLLETIFNNVKGSPYIIDKLAGIAKRDNNSELRAALDDLIDVGGDGGKKFYQDTIIAVLFNWLYRLARVVEKYDED